MAHVAVEAVILTPLLVAQILLFPYVASTMSSYWTNASQQLALQETASQMGNTIQQLYISVSQTEFSAGTITQASTFPTEIAAHQYTAKGILKASLNPNSQKVLLLNLTLQGLGNTVTATASLGSNVLWNGNSVFYSESTSASIKVQKFSNGTILFWFG